jgi:hypothetical protein
MENNIVKELHTKKNLSTKKVKTTIFMGKPFSLIEIIIYDYDNV